jgi:hypothetical protein
MYAGTAAGSKRAHSKIIFPGKLYLVTTQAVDTPNIKLREPTPSIKINVLLIYRERTVENKWGHKDVSPKKAE